MKGNGRNEWRWDNDEEEEKRSSSCSHLKSNLVFLFRTRLRHGRPSSGNGEPRSAKRSCSVAILDLEDEAGIGIFEGLFQTSIKNINLLGIHDETKKEEKLLETVELLFTCLVQSSDSFLFVPTHGA
ncbi:hypothetical protein F2P81_017625 [Scophthalmus maximus]|uniref:Uncharacterized protein n=1 Tax=Scophthalmus maximus TaxID=52904 RepID=A0A6A4SIU9_SCOMX|nr:hypothetical protein F2P81_017625 [Scophthalmus maximus]